MDIALSCMTWLPILCVQLRRVFVLKHKINANCSFLDNGSICHKSPLANGPCDDSRYNNSSLPENSFLLLSDDIIVNIFSTLDAKCAFQCSQICRSLSVILSGPYFIATHRSQATPSLIVQRFEWRDKSDLECGTVVHRVDLFENIVTLRMKIKSRHGWPNIEYKPLLVGSYNGFVLLKNHIGVDSVLFIWNPVTNEQVTVIAPKPEYLVCGLFLHSSTGEFRILYMRYKLPMSRCLIISLHINLLREISYCSLVPCTLRPPVILNKELHWIVLQDLSNPRSHESSICSKLILVFKIASEVFSTIPHPQIENCSYNRHRRMNLLEMEGHLCLCDVTSATDLDVWVLQEKQVWVRMHNISTKSVVPKRLRHCSMYTTQYHIWKLCTSTMMNYY